MCPLKQSSINNSLTIGEIRRVISDVELYKYAKIKLTILSKIGECTTIKL